MEAAAVDAGWLAWMRRHPAVLMRTALVGRIVCCRMAGLRFGGARLGRIGEGQVGDRPSAMIGPLYCMERGKFELCPTLRKHRSTPSRDNVMDITPGTKALIRAVLALKPQHPEEISTLFIDFYCQCREGCDYLFPPPVKDSVRLLDILQWFIECIEYRQPTPLIRLMWNDVMGPTLGEYLVDEKTEARLQSAFKEQLPELIKAWDRVQLPSGSVQLVLRDLLADICAVEATHRSVCNAESSGSAAH